MNQSMTPLYSKLIKHHEGNPISFHVPGHKYGEVFPESGQSYYRDLLKLDATEITGLDDLHSPDGVILEAEHLLAQLYRTEKSYFLINGSTVGNLAMILATVNEDDIVLVQRNSHKSIMNGLRLAKAQPVFIGPEFDSVFGVAGGVDLEMVQSALNQYPAAKALILTYPNYYGLTYDLKSIIDFAHGRKIPVLVDEAHGVHFAAGGYFPPTAVELGADVIVQSAHKTLPAMTMGAFLHYQSELVPQSQLELYLQTLQSSSPSYPIMASLDIARSYLGTYTNDDMDYLQEVIEQFRRDVSTLDTLSVLQGDDPLKITIKANGSLTGYELQHQLESHGVFTELADPENVLLVLPLLKRGMQHRLQEAAGKITLVASRIPKSKQVPQLNFTNEKSISALSLGYKQMEKLETEIISLELAAGKVCAESIIPYPPGIPLCLPGEILNGEDIEAIHYLRKMGAKIQGGDYLAAGKIKVFKSWGI
jgi:arginine/lysine/ornithine decarboxylase